MFEKKNYSFGVCQPSLSLSRFKIILDPVLHLFCDYLCRIRSCFHAKILEKLMPDQVCLPLTSQRSRCWREQPGRRHYRQVHYHLSHYHHHHHYYHQKSLTRTRQKEKPHKEDFGQKLHFSPRSTERCRPAAFEMVGDWRRAALLYFQAPLLSSPPTPTNRERLKQRPSLASLLHQSCRYYKGVPAKYVFLISWYQRFHSLVNAWSRLEHCCTRLSV